MLLFFVHTIVVVKQEQEDDLVAPGPRHGRPRDGVLEGQTRGREDGRQFAQTHVRVHVRAARRGDARREFRVAGAGQARGRPRHGERQRHGLSGIVRRDLARQDENARTDRAANANANQVPHGQVAVQLMDPCCCCCCCCCTIVPLLLMLLLLVNDSQRLADPRRRMRRVAGGR